MKQKAVLERRQQESPKVAVVKRFLALAQTVRRTGNPDLAIAAAEWERVFETAVKGGGSVPSRILAKAA